MNLRRYQSQLIAAAMAMMCTAAQGAAANSIEVKDFMFAPMTLTVNVVGMNMKSFTSMLLGAAPSAAVHMIAMAAATSCD